MIPSDFRDRRRFITETAARMGVCLDEERGATERGRGGGSNRTVAVSGDSLGERDAACHEETVRRPYATGDRHFAIRGVRAGMSADATDPDAALEAALADLDGEPGCAVCPSSADFFLWEEGRVEKFVCWEHVSPVSAAVGGTVDESDRPIAVRLE